MDKFHFTNNFASTSKKNFNDKNIDADSMINNIISQQDTFVVNKDHQFYSNLPKWMIPKSGFVHPLYEQIWQYVKSDKRDRSCDTNLVSQLLMTSGLPIDVLGGLWSMANIGVDGSLSQQELYIILALVTLVQNGYSVSNVSLLQHIHKPIIPQLNYSLVEKKHNTSSMKSNIEHKMQQITNKSNTISNKYQHENIHSKSIQQPNCNVMSSEDYDPLAVTFIEPKTQMSRTVPSLTASLEPKSLDLAPVNDSFETFDDEFSDFQCAEFSFTDYKNNHEFTNFQSAFDTLSLNETTKSNVNDVGLLNASSVDETSNSIEVSSVDATLNSFENELNLISCQDDDIHDKYEVFRNLASETVGDKDLTNNDLIIHNNLNDHNDLLNINSIKNIEVQVENDEEFGEFLCVEDVMNNKQEIEVDPKNVQIQCIKKCLELLEEGFSTLSGISDEKILLEVINHDKGIKYLTQLSLISQICKRILKNCHCPMLEDSLTDKMSKLEMYLMNCTQEPNKNSKVSDSTNETVPCYLCKCNCKMDSIEYMMNHYHPSCINLLIHFVQTSSLSVK